MFASAADIEIESPFPNAHLPAVWKWIEPFRDRIFDDFCPRSLAEFVAWHEARSHLPGRSTYGVRKGGDLGGLVVIERPKPNYPTALAHIMFRKECWGHSTTIPALQDIAERVFDSGVLAIRSEVFRQNHAIISLIEKLGGVRYGIPGLDRWGKPIALPIPNATLLRGEPQDVVGLVLTREGLHGNRSSFSSNRGRKRRVQGNHGRQKRDADEHTATGPGGASIPEQSAGPGDGGSGQPVHDKRVPGLPQSGGNQRKQGD